MKRWPILLWALALPVYAGASGGLNEKTWNYGSEDCDTNRDPAIEVFKFDPATYILRQNKCVNFEAPFIYVLFGEHAVFVQDTGATSEADRFPLYAIVRALIAERTHGKELKILVTHSHSHGDHTAADAQFRGKAGVTLIEPSAQAVIEYFGFKQWPDGTAPIDLGGRTLVVVPAPGHQAEGIAVYDEATKWLLTGDSLYPGRLYVKDWAAYRLSINRLVTFAKEHEISAVMGTHIEMSRVPGKLFDAGSTFQPNEAFLPLTVDDLRELNQALVLAGDEPKEIPMAKFVVTPIGMMLGAIQSVLASIFKFLKAPGPL